MLVLVEICLPSLILIIHLQEQDKAFKDKQREEAKKLAAAKASMGAKGE